VQATLAQVGKAVTECIKMRDVFTQQTVMEVLGQLALREPLPTLIMRTLINAWHEHPDAHRCASLAVRCVDLCALFFPRHTR
jgi:Symplekin tight junction protein C terminal